MKYTYISAICFGLLFWAGCNDEDDITPREKGEMGFDFPQGNHDYDMDMVEYNEKYGFYPLYVFSQRDLYWNNTEWLEPSESGENVMGLLGKNADALYVGKQWQMCKQLFLDNYPDKMLSEGMPIKMLLCSELAYKEYNKRTREYDTIVRHAYMGYDYLAVNYGDASIDTVGDRTKMEFQRVVNTLFLQREFARGKFEVPEAFSKVSSYTYQYISGSSEQCYELGFVKYDILVNKNVPQSILNDFETYLELIATPLAVLEDEPAPLGDYYNDYYVGMKGVLNPKRDKSGKIRQKYEILVTYFRACGVDTDRLQRPDLNLE